MAISRFLKRLRPQPPYPDLPAPKDPICIIGDIHGRSDLLDTLVRQLCCAPHLGRTRVILVGDLIDRGPDSAGVLACVRDWCDAPAPFAAVDCLMGNHERMMLDFLDDPVTQGPHWLSHGGEATLESFGLSPHRRPPDSTADSALVALRDDLLAALPEGLQDWIRARPLIWQDGPLVITHAGADPDSPMEAQSDTSLLWGHRAFLTRPRRDGLWVAHGHVITRTPEARTGRIAVDTGAWQTGCLTAARLAADGLRFISTPPPEEP
ncbi:metallophosphoesterase [Pseudotabrizicola formosa]|uniref:metallophosphoesterase n=1 Tax=Pseudotabrizicola formosa TaxID=2030009 RepID=UPI000CD2709E|nr:metallophosphoesterase [Pseudotabrizicola formosa]